VRFGVFEADLDTGELRKHGMRLKLPHRAFRVLQVLIERPNEVISRDELRQSLWPVDTFVEFDHGLNNAVNRLRDVLGDDAQSPRFIETVPRRGYRFIGPAPAPASQAMTTTPIEADAPPPSIPTTPTQARVSPARWAALAAVVIAVVVAALLTALPARRELTAGTDPARVEALAVLPFLNLSTDPAQEYFADGMTEALISELSIAGAFRVISRTSAMRYKTANKPATVIASELGVNAIVEGSVLREGNRVRVTVQLIGVPSDTHLWAKTYERELDTVLALQREVARSIAEAVHLTVGGGDRRTTRAVDPKVYELYLRGRHLLNRRSEADLQKALEYFALVIEHDPTYAPAHAATAAAWEAMSDWNNFVAPREGLPKAKAAALRALELDESLAEAHVRLAFVNEAYEWRLPEAERGYQRALELDPNDADAYEHYALYLSRVARNEEAVEMGRRAQQLDPLSLSVNVQYGTRLLDNGRVAEALTHLERTIELDPNYFDTYVHLSHVYEVLRRPADQVAAARRGTEVSGRAAHALQALARAYAVSGNQVEAMKVLDELHQRPTQRNAYDVAMIHLRLKQYDRALQWLVKACDERAAALAFFRMLHNGRQFDPIRNDERFAQVIDCSNRPLPGSR
jgi:TolB-like protein/DNA-binding winged helix-turn-helix (wHTH) protein/tetratricopeptide (TPR) repeat protein